MARILIVGGGCRGRQLSSSLSEAGHAVRITTRTQAARPAIEASGAECWIGTPDRLATLRGALDGVTIVCWLLGSASGSPGELSALHGSRLEMFATQAIDTTVRGFIYETRGTTTPAAILDAGSQTVRIVAERNAIPLALLTADLREPAAWLQQARDAVDSLLTGG